MVKLKFDDDTGSATEDDTNLDGTLTEERTCSGSDVDFHSFMNQYSNFMKFNNNLDLMDVLNRLRKEIGTNEELQKFVQCDNFLLLDTPRDRLEVGEHKIVYRLQKYCVIMIGMLHLSGFFTMSSICANLALKIWRIHNEVFNCQTLTRHFTRLLNFLLSWHL